MRMMLALLLPVWTLSGTGIAQCDPSVVGATSTSSAESVVLVGSIAYVADGTGLRTVDVSDPASPKTLAVVSADGFVSGVDVLEGLAYLSGTAGLQIYDVSDPATPAKVGALTTAGSGEAVTIAGYLAYVADGAAGLQVIDVSNRLAPTLMGSLDTPGLASDVVVCGSIAYLADGAGGLHLIDVSDPGSPVSLGTEASFSANGVALSGSLAYVASGQAGLMIVDVSDSSRPSVVGSLATPGLARGVTVVRSRALVAGEAAGVHVIDVLDPAQPVLLGSVALPGPAMDLAATEPYASVAGGTSGLHVIDIASCQDEPCPRILVGEEQLLTNHVRSDWAASVSGSRTVFVTTRNGSEDVYKFDPDFGELPLALGSWRQDDPDIDGRQVVWVDNSNHSNLRLADYDTGVIQVLTNRANPNYAPAISGDRVAFISLMSGNPDLYWIDTVTFVTQPISQSAWAEQEPDIDGDLVAWHVFTGSSRDVFANHLGGPVFSVAETSADERSVSVDGDRIAYLADGNVVVHEVSTGRTFCITDDHFTRTPPLLHGDFVFWSDDRHGELDVFAHDLLEGRTYTITAPPGDQTVTSVTDGRLVCNDDRLGNLNVLEIAFTVRSRPIADAGPDRTVMMGRSVQLQGSAEDPDGDPIQSWRWELRSAPAGSSPRLFDADTPSPWFFTDAPGKYELALRVSDPCDESLPDEVVITSEDRRRRVK